MTHKFDGYCSFARAHLATMERTAATHETPEVTVSPATSKPHMFDGCCSFARSHFAPMEGNSSRAEEQQKAEDRIVPALETIIRQIVENPPTLEGLFRQSAETAFEDGMAAYQRRDYGTAMRLWRPLADKDHAGAQCYLGILYEEGWGVAQDYAAALSWYRKAADQGNAFGQLKLGFFCEHGYGGLPKDDRQAARFYKLAADQGDATAQNNLGVFYSQGRGGLPKDEHEAARLYRLAERRS
jgi:Sel1 repeat